MSLLTSILCSFCHELYDDSTRRPRLGDCFHTICEQCQSKRDSFTCPVCKKENAFERTMYNFQLIGISKEIRKNLTEEHFEKLKSNPTKISFGACSSLNCVSSEGLRFCVTCSEESGLVRKRPNRTLELVEQNKSIHLMKNCLVCADCILEECHPKHEFIPISNISALTEYNELWYFLIHGLLLEQKFEEVEDGKDGKDGENDFWNDMIKTFCQEAIQYTIFVKAIETNFVEDQIKLNNFFENIHQIPHLSEAKEKSFQIANEIAKKNLKLRERILIYKKEEINGFILFVSEKLTASENHEYWENVKTKLSAVLKMFEKIKITDMSQEEIEKIDEKIETRMELLEKLQRELEPISDEEVDEESKFFKFRALRKEFIDISKNLEAIEMKMDQEVMKFHKFTQNRLERIHEIDEKLNDDLKFNPNFLNVAKKLFLYEVTDRSFEIDKIIIERLKGTGQILKTHLMFLRFFKKSTVKTYEDKTYIDLLEEKREGRSWIHQLLSASIFS